MSKFIVCYLQSHSITEQKLFQPYQPGLRMAEKVDQPNQPKTVFLQIEHKNPYNQ